MIDEGPPWHVRQLRGRIVNAKTLQELEAVGADIRPRGLREEWLAILRQSYQRRREQLKQSDGR